MQWPRMLPTPGGSGEPGKRIAEELVYFSDRPRRFECLVPLEKLPPYCDFPLKEDNSVSKRRCRWPLHQGALRASRGPCSDVVRALR
jgi:hypothetical protein